MSEVEKTNRPFTFDKAINTRNSLVSEIKKRMKQNKRIRKAKLLRILVAVSQILSELAHKLDLLVSFYRPVATLPNEFDGIVSIHPILEYQVASNDQAGSSATCIAMNRYLRRRRHFLDQQQRIKKIVERRRSGEVSDRKVDELDYTVKSLDKLKKRNQKLLHF